ncbi:hypothetical protein [Proteiniclasticum ruminis]|uniref:Uncharacterized protein n=1 Tax=Proteiniclasticum ruminis TaxID=398199 RepID=A0A1I5BE94_9CLOT|nr:hypothetical protein [Proteiniclasticum ruminis]SFN73034.1 hypothetical protein SAMN04488695_104169 [Proteiniclasticum ruminis]
MKRRFLIGGLLLGIMMITGCQLAKEEEQVSKGRFIGVYLRTDRMGHLAEEDLPAVVYDEETETYEVKEEKGYFFFSPSVTKKDGESYQEQVTSGHLSDMNITASVGEGGGTALDVEAVLYFTEKNQIFYPYRIRQDENGEVFMQRSDDMGYQVDHLSAVMLSEDASYDEIGNNEGYQMKFKVSFLYKAAPETVRIFEMGKDHTIRKETVIPSSENLEEYRPEKDTAYLLLEYETSSEGEDSIERLLVSKEEESFPLYEEADGVLLKKLVPILWEE